MRTRRSVAATLARSKGTSGVDVKTSGYSSYQVFEKNQPARWRVTQSVTLEGADFATLAALGLPLDPERG